MKFILAILAFCFAAFAGDTLTTSYVPIDSFTIQRQLITKDTIRTSWDLKWLKQQRATVAALRNAELATLDTLIARAAKLGLKERQGQILP
jgi:hypothetical protein